jgi:hypothetical protein
MTQKLRDVFDSLFGINKGTDKGDVSAKQDSLSLMPKESRLGVQEEYVIIITAKDNNASPISNVDIELVIIDNDIVELLDKLNKKKTDKNGFALYKIRGKKEGETKVHVFAEIDKETRYSQGMVIVAPPTTQVGISFPDNLNPKKQIFVEETAEITAVATKSDGAAVTTPQIVIFEVSDKEILDFVDPSPEGSVTKETGKDGRISIKIKGVNSGKTKITATIMGQGEQSQPVTASMDVEVISI